jgi:cytoskeleton protein RodZ
MAESIGEKLRLAREARGIALRDISEQTRISIRYLEAIEGDDYRRLPGGIFNRSFIRAYAKFIGYDEHDALEDYARTLRERGESDDEGSKMHQSLVYTDDGGSHSRSPLITLLLAIRILAALSLAVWAGLHFYQRSQHPRGASEPGMNDAPLNSSINRESAMIPATANQKTIKPKTVQEGPHDFIV